METKESENKKNQQEFIKDETIYQGPFDTRISKGRSPKMIY